LDTGAASGLFFICGCNNDQVNGISIGHRMYACIEKEIFLQRAEEDGILKYLMVCTSLLQQFNN
jgi:hypothetical protein